MAKGRREWMFWIPFIMVAVVAVYGFWKIYDLDRRQRAWEIERQQRKSARQP